MIPWAPAPNRNAQKYKEVEEKAQIRRGCVLCLGKWRTVNSPKRMEERELHQSEVFSHLQVIASANREITLKGVISGEQQRGQSRLDEWLKPGSKNWLWTELKCLYWLSIPSLIIWQVIGFMLRQKKKNTVSFCIILWTWCLSKVNWHQGTAG